MRALLYDTLIADADLQSIMGGVEGIKGRVVPRASQDNVNLPKPFIIYGLGNNTNENLSEDPEHEAHRQFSQIWIHDDSGDYSQIDAMISFVKSSLTGLHSTPHHVLGTIWLETSQEFVNDAYQTIFRYVRFQHIIAKGVPIS